VCTSLLTLLSREIGRIAIYYPDNNSTEPYSLVAFSLIRIRFTAVAKPAGGLKTGEKRGENVAGGGLRKKIKKNNP